VSVNAQGVEIPGEVVIDLSLQDFGNPASVPTTGDSLRDALDPPFGSVIDGRDFFEATTDGVTTSNSLIAPITFDVVESPGLQLTIEDATATTGIDGFGGDNRASFNVNGVGLNLQGPPQRSDPAVPVGESGAVASSGSRLDFTHDEFLTLSFNTDVTVFGIGVTDFDDGETFTFGSATDLTNASLVENALGFNSFTQLPNVDFLPFDAPLELAAGELILIGNTAFFDAASGGRTGVGFEQILLTVTGEVQIPDPVPVPEPSSLAVLGLSGLLIASRRRR